MRDDPVDAPQTSDLGGHMDAASAARAEPRICPFLRAADAEGSLGDPVLWPNEANRCVALGDAAPQSLRQQEYACLASAHLNCPRFIRGGLGMVDPAPPVRGTATQLTPAIVGALLVLAGSFVLSVAFVVANGGMGLSTAPGASQEAGQASVSPAPTGTPPAAGATPSPSIAASPEPSAEASVGAATPAPTIQPTPSPSDPPTPSPTPSPTSDRYALLEACPDAPDCWIYTIRSGDNLVSIARYFGVPLEVVSELNPWTETTPLVAGQQLRLPPPTR